MVFEIALEQLAALEARKSGAGALLNVIRGLGAVQNTLGSYSLWMTPALRLGTLLDRMRWAFETLEREIKEGGAADRFTHYDSHMLGQLVQVDILNGLRVACEEMVRERPEDTELREMLRRHDELARAQGLTEDASSANA